MPRLLPPAAPDSACSLDNSTNRSGTRHELRPATTFGGVFLALI
jgi:hypothetical protein